MIVCVCSRCGTPIEEGDINYAQKSPLGPICEKCAEAERLEMDSVSKVVGTKSETPKEEKPVGKRKVSERVEKALDGFYLATQELLDAFCEDEKSNMVVIAEMSIAFNTALNKVIREGLGASEKGDANG